MAEVSHASYIHDPIHGHIELTGLEMSVVDTLEFQRLRFIRQNSLLHYVFPGAFHTRFAHSLGTCHISSQIARQIIPWVNEPEIYYPLQVYRLAALLHDVGHGAFSHSLSGIKISGKSFIPCFQNIFENGSLWGVDNLPIAVREGLEVAFKMHKKEAVEHEALSVLIIQQIFSYLEESDQLGDFHGAMIPSSTWVRDISALLIREIPVSDHFNETSDELLSQAQRDFPRLDKCSIDLNSYGDGLSQVLSELVSGSVDADRMDYLLRDSAGCGVNYGMYDQEGIISSMRLVFFKGKLRLALNAKRVNTLDDFLWSRYQMFKQVYCHKTHSAYNLLLERAMEDLIDEGQLAAPSSLLEYCQLTDDLIMAKVFSETQKNPNRRDWMGAFAKRKLPKLIAVVEASTTDPVWKMSSAEIFSKSEGINYQGAQYGANVISTSMKAEVLKGNSNSLPLIFSYNKVHEKYESQDFVAKSVFFSNHEKIEDQVQELKDRLNKRLMFFYKI